MREWQRATHTRSCGVCGKTEDVPQIHRGDPILVITIQGIERERIRCAGCAGEHVPDDLPELSVREIRQELDGDQRTFMPLGTLARSFRDTNQFDWKAAMADNDSADHDECED